MNTTEAACYFLQQVWDITLKHVHTCACAEYRLHIIGPSPSINADSIIIIESVYTVHVYLLLCVAHWECSILSRASGVRYTLDFTQKVRSEEMIEGGATIFT